MVRAWDDSVWEENYSSAWRLHRLNNEQTFFDKVTGRSTVIFICVIAILEEER